MGLPRRPPTGAARLPGTLTLTLTSPNPNPDPDPNSNPAPTPIQHVLAYETLEEDFAALIVTVGARRGAAASSSPDLAPATAITLDAASPDASGGAAGEPTSETTGGASDDKMREELERLKRMLRHEETYP